MITDERVIVTCSVTMVPDETDWKERADSVVVVFRLAFDSTDGIDRTVK